jgi:ubiquinone/menaquinone biosynthesis C-methylase UbiE
MTRRTTARASLEDFSGAPPANYERYFVPHIGAPLAVKLVDTAAPEPGERVLDVACGTGVVTRLAAERVGASGAVTGLDSNPGMLGIAHAIPASGASIKWREADAAATGLPDGAFDVVLCQMGLQFFPDKAAAIEEMRRVLKPGGRLVLNVPGPAPRMFEILEDALADKVSAEAARFVSTVFSLYDTGELERLLEGAGFSEISVTRRRELLDLPPATEFLWQYVSSTPLAPALGALDADARAVLAHDVTRQWEPFGTNGSMMLEVDVVVAGARR